MTALAETPSVRPHDVAPKTWRCHEGHKGTLMPIRGGKRYHCFGCEDEGQMAEWDGDAIEGLNSRRKARRGTSNGNERGSAQARRERKAWLMERWRANVDMVPKAHERKYSSSLMIPDEIEWSFDLQVWLVEPGKGLPATRCYRCGVLMLIDEVTIDRILAGDEGGSYSDRRNIRPCCGPCNEATGRVRAHQPKRSPKCVSCPTCGAARNQYCRLLGGTGVTGSYHKARRQKASKAPKNSQ